MAEIVAGFLGPAIEVAKWVAAPMKRQFNYLCCFTTNIAVLEKEAEELQVAASALQGKVDRARNNLRVISGEVETWLQKSKDITDEKDVILKEVPNVGSGCLKLIARFSLSKRAMKTTDLLKELRGQCKFDADAISQPRPPSATEAIPSERTYDFESRRQIEEDIMGTLRLGDLNMMGICGMGGLGKTTMAKRVANRALEEGVFKEVVFVVVSQPSVDKLKLQVDIGRSLGLSDLKDETSEVRAAQILRARLSGSERILLVLDDVWEILRLEDLGIPTNHKGFMILSTSRNGDVLSAMNAQKVFGMQVLLEEDAWFLFSERAGTCVGDKKVKSIAKEVVNECKGLPIALTTVGSALREEMNVGIWKDALRQLRLCDPDIPDLIANVYNPLQLSYDFLEPIYKYVFLICCLYPEDAHISLEDLTYYCMGLGVFEGGIEEGRNRMQALASMLKRRSLLLDSDWGDKYVRMHDVVRDVCIFVAKREGYIGGSDCIWMSLFEGSKFPTELGFPKLRLLWWKPNDKLNLGGRFLEGINDLRVLCIDKNDLLTSLPLTTQSLKNLKTLVLDSCFRLEALSGVGELLNLEILICRYCQLIKELSSDMKGLNRLKLLDLTSCENLERIGRGIIASLLGLEELYMLGSFKKWEAENREERENAALRELEALTNLRCLKIRIEDPALAAENMRLSSKLEKYDIRFPGFNNVYGSYNTIMCLLLGEERCVGDWIKMQLLRDTEYLILEGSGAIKVDFTTLEKIRYLELRRCGSMKKIMISLMDDCGGPTILSSIEGLRLRDLPKLEEIWDVQISSNHFQNLKKLELYHLPALKQVWEGRSQGMDYLPQLQVLTISSCKMLERVFKWEGEDENEGNSIRSPNSHHITTKILPKLNSLELDDLPNLTRFCHGIQCIQFPQLRELNIARCSKMNIMVWESNENNSGGSNSNAQIQDLHHQPQEMLFGCLKRLETDLYPFCGCKIDVSLFNGLEELDIRGNRGSVICITPSIAENLFNLKRLDIFLCDEMVKVIEDDDEKLVSGGEMISLFPKLETLALIALTELVSFCDWKCDVELPSLWRLRIWDCDNLKNFTLGHLDTPNLKQVEINSDENLGVVKDLNGMVQQRYYSARAKEEEEEVGEIEDEQDS